MRITYFITGIGLSGGPMTLYNFMNGLVKTGHEVFVVTLDEYFRWDFDTYKKHTNKKKTFGEKLTDFRVKQYYRARYYLNAFLKACSFKTQIGKDKVLSITDRLISNYAKLGIDSDVLIATMTYTGDAVYKLGCGKKLVMHNQHFEELVFGNDENARALLRALTLLPFHHIVNCAWLDKMFQYNYGITGTVITPGIDTSIFDSEVNPNKYLGAKKIRLITYCDPNRKFKGSDQQLNILEKLCTKNKNVEISIYGIDPKTTRFPYTFLGWISQKQLADFYAKSHLLLSFSWYESFPLPPIEAMACGCAVVAGKYGTEDYLIDNETGIVLNPFNADEAVAKIEELINQPEKMLKLAQNGREMSKKFRWETEVEKLNKFLTNLPTPRSVNISEIQKGNLSEMDKIYEQKN